MADDLITFDDKEQYQDIQTIPHNKKVTYTDMNEVKQVVNTNALKLPFFMVANGSGIITGSELVGVDVRAIKGENIFFSKDNRFKKEISEDTIYDLDGVTPLQSFTSGDTYELTPNNTK